MPELLGWGNVILFSNSLLLKLDDKKERKLEKI